MKNLGNSKRARWVHRTLLASIATCGCHSTRPCGPREKYAAWPPEAPAVDRELTALPLALQARNGEILDSTLFNYHFRSDYMERPRPDGSLSRLAIPLPTADLTPAGVNLIQRISRRTEPNCQLRLFVQVATDVALNPKDMAASVAKRADINRKRVEAVEEFVRSLRPDLQVRIDLIDPDPVGMSATEAVKGVQQHQNNTHGILRPDNYDPRSGSSSPSSPPPPDPPQTDPGSSNSGLNPG